MDLQITFTAQRRDDTLALSKDGDAVVINGLRFDFSALADGDTLPAQAGGTDWLAGPVVRDGGTLILSIIWPHGRGEHVAPDLITVTADGPIAFDGAGGQVDLIGDGVVDESKISPATPLSDVKTAAQRRVDSDAGRITTDTIGGLAEEYATAERHALEFQTAGFLPPVPASVQSWSDAKAIRGIVFTPQQAAEDILATAAAWRGALDTIRQQRLNAKAYIDMASDAAAVDAAYSAWLGFVSAIRAQLGLPS